MAQDRFLQDFGEVMDDDSEEDEPRGGKEFAPAAAATAAAAAAAAARKSGGKPAEHTALFEGNTDDHFRLGIKLTRWG